MALIKAMALGAVAGIALPFVMRHESGMLGVLAQWGTVRPPAGGFGLMLSVPVFLGVALFGWVLLKVAEDR